MAGFQFNGLLSNSAQNQQDQQTPAGFTPQGYSALGSRINPAAFSSVPLQQQLANFQQQQAQGAPAASPPAWAGMPTPQGYNPAMSGPNNTAQMPTPQGYNGGGLLAGLGGQQPQPQGALTGGPAVAQASAMSPNSGAIGAGMAAGMNPQILKLLMGAGSGTS